ncbi:helix-turn-helix domain-containing protein [Neobacillus mesonae]|uniref:helix-turn-helix domain-containing protein n=1 Tax=Neobacillus mesonae TaxID=1193713 RepID=UPI00082FDF2B|nr:helix-turn-helix domain-containing protein [Neobacillus mesonae]
MEQRIEQEFGLGPVLGQYFSAIPDETILSISDISELLGRSEETIRRWCREGKLPSYSFGGKYGILGAEFKNFILNSKKRSKKVRRDFQCH